MNRFFRLFLPVLFTLPTAASAEDTRETIEVIGTAPRLPRPPRPALMRPNPPEFALESRVFHFPSGLRVVMQAEHSHPIVSILMIVDHGAGDDPPGKNGTAHFVEHTWFRSIHGELPPIMTLIQDIGADFNATTRPDTTDYRTVASAEFLPLLLRLESKRLTEPYIGMTEDQVDTEREVIRNEWRRRNEQSTSLVFDYLLKSIFPEGHPYHGRETNESLDAIDLKTLTDYFDAYYTPDKTTIIVVGDFDIDESLNLILANFDPEVLHPDLKAEHILRYPRAGVEEPDPNNEDHWNLTAVNPANPDEPLPILAEFPPRVSPQPPPMPPAPPKGVQTYKAPVDNRTVLVGWALPGGFRGKDTDMAILANTATNLIWRSLYMRGLLDRDNRKAGLKDPGCFPVPMKVHSVLACAIEVTDTKRYPDPERVANMLIDQLPPLWDPEQATVGQRYMGQGKNSEIARVLRSVDDVAFHFDGRAEDIGFHFHQTGSATFHSDRMREIARLDLAVVADLGYKHLKRDRAAIVVIDPMPDKEIDRSAETSSYRGASDTDTVAEDGTAMTNMTEEAIEATYVKPDLSQIVDRKLRNGLRVVILPHGSSPLVETTLVLGGGTAMQPKGLFGFLGLFTKDASDLPTHDPLMIAASTTGGATSNNWSTGLRAPAGNLDGALWLLREEMESTVPDMAGRATYVKKRRDGFLGSLHRAGWHTQDIRARHLYPENPESWPTQWEDVQAISSWKSPIVSQTLADMLQPENATLMIVGNIDPDNALRLAIDYFAGWEPRTNAKIGQADRPAVGGMSSSSKVLIFDDPKRTQTEVTRICRLNTTGIEDRQAASVLSNLLFDRTFSQLRVKEGLAYSPGGFARVGPDGSGIMGFSSLAVNVGVGRTVEFFNELTAELERGEADNAMLTLYKARLARNHGVSAQSTSQMTDKLTSAITWQQPWSLLLEAGRHIASVDPQSIQRLVQGCNGRAITTLEGPAEVIEPQLKAKGIDYEVVDWKERGKALHAEYDPKGFAKREKAKAKAKAKAAKSGTDTSEPETSDEVTPDSGEEASD